jgi:thioesterase domain-containing protein
MAARYIAAIRVVQPEGPYLLGGWSFGGIVAFEMAQQFLRQGESVSMLAIIDVGTPHAIPTLNETAFLAAYTLSVIYRRTTKTFQDLYDDLGRLPLQSQIQYMLENMRMAGLALPEDGATWLLQQLQIARARIQARQDYQPQIYPGRITLFHAREQGALELHPELQLDWQQWQEFTHEPMEIYQVPGDHDSLLNEPHVQVLAQYLQAALDNTKGKRAEHRRCDSSSTKNVESMGI